ncbi:replication protein [Clostridium chromiireducens]|uniref:ATP-dependent helicase Rep n=1 Tax=Clostridium chromiireducens TaxID=225345 RepID=A0A964W1B7_9CLOT|nr:replication protein [Clostridium chromiireducens]MVX63129.1 replication protein [Clostridium chromiireducens]
MKNDSRSRKWQLTLNNPVDKGYTHEVLKEKLKEFKNLIYWCMSDEIGENGTYHTHVFIACSGAVRFSTIQNRFKGAHFEMANGTCKQNREYVFKEGKWLGDKKQDTNLPDTHEEYGDCPVERQGQRNDLIDLYDMIKTGMSNFDIIDDNPNYMLEIDRIEKVRQTVRDEQFKNTFRELDVTYIYGSTGAGKTRGVMEQYGYSNVFRVTDYDHPFDSYKGQDVIIFEEFRDSLKISDMLNLLDGYPLELPCRYANKIACYTKVYIITNLDLNDQYKGVQVKHPETWRAFLRRIHKIKHYTKSSVSDYTLQEYLDRDLILVDEISPFEQEKLEV